MSDVDEAERLSSRRPGMLMVMTYMFLFQQFAYFTQPPATGRALDYVRIGAWLLLALVVLAALLTGGFWQKSKAVRALLEDEVTRANRADVARSRYEGACLRRDLARERRQPARGDGGAGDGCPVE